MDSHECFFHLHPIFEPLMVLYMSAFFLDDFTEMVKIRIGIYSGKFKEQFNKRRGDLKDKIEAAIRYHNSRLRKETEKQEVTKDGFESILRITTKIKESFEDLLIKLDQIKLNIPKTSELFEQVRDLKFKNRFLFFAIYILFILIINGFEVFWNYKFLNQLIIFNEIFLGLYLIYFLSSFKPHTPFHRVLNMNSSFRLSVYILIPALSYFIFSNTEYCFLGNNLHLALNISCLVVSILPFPFAFARVLLSKDWQKKISDSIIDTKIKDHEDDVILKREELRSAWDAWSRSSSADESLKTFLSKYKNEDKEKESGS